MDNKCPFLPFFSIMASFRLYEVHFSVCLLGSFSFSLPKNTTETEKDRTMSFVFAQGNYVRNPMAAFFFLFSQLRIDRRGKKIRTRMLKYPLVKQMKEN